MTQPNRNLPLHRSSVGVSTSVKSLNETVDVSNDARAFGLVKPLRVTT